MADLLLIKHCHILLKAVIQERHPIGPCLPHTPAIPQLTVSLGYSVHHEGNTALIHRTQATPPSPLSSSMSPSPVT